MQLRGKSSRDEHNGKWMPDRRDEICAAMRKTFSASSSNVTRELIVPIPGEPTINIHCGINTSDQSVAYARVSQPPNLTTNDLTFLRSRGYCS
jgi:hypothetical protein